MIVFNCLSQARFNRFAFACSQNLHPYKKGNTVIYRKFGTVSRDFFAPPPPFFKKNPYDSKTAMRLVQLFAGFFRFRLVFLFYEFFVKVLTVNVVTVLTVILLLYCLNCSHLKNKSLIQFKHTHYAENETI